MFSFESKDHLEVPRYRMGYKSLFATVQTCYLKMIIQQEAEVVRQALALSDVCVHVNVTHTHNTFDPVVPPWIIDTGEYSNCFVVNENKSISLRNKVQEKLCDVLWSLRKLESIYLNSKIFLISSFYETLESIWFLKIFLCANIGKPGKLAADLTLIKMLLL